MLLCESLWYNYHSKNRLVKVRSPTAGRHVLKSTQLVVAHDSVGSVAAPAVAARLCFIKCLLLVIILLFFLCATLCFLRDSLSDSYTTKIHRETQRITKIFFPIPNYYLVSLPIQSLFFHLLSTD